MNPETIFLQLVDLLLKSTIVFAIAWLVARVWRGASAANRHLVWLAAFTLLLLLPLTKIATPRWEVNLKSNSTHPGEKTVTTTAPLKTAAPEAGQTDRLMLDHLRDGAMIVWLAGIFVILTYRAAGSLQLRRLMKLSRPVNSNRLLLLSRKVAGKNRTNVELRESDHTRVPLTWGIRHPVILLPAFIQEWSDAQVETVLQHETGHIRRRDCLARLLAQIVCAIYWMNPLAWLAARKLRLAQEIACDDLVLNSGAGAPEYANQLVEIVRNLQSGHLHLPQALAMIHPSALEIRVRSIVEPDLDRRPLGRATIAISLFFAGAMLSLFTLAQIHAVEASPIDEKKPVAANNGPLMVDIKSDESTFENGIALAKGHVVLKYKGLTINADTIEYDPKTENVSAEGHVRVENKDGQIVTTMVAEKLTYNLNAKFEGKQVGPAQ